MDEVDSHGAELLLGMVGPNADGARPFRPPDCRAKFVVQEAPDFYHSLPPWMQLLNLAENFRWAARPTSSAFAPAALVVPHRLGGAGLDFSTGASAGDDSNAGTGIPGTRELSLSQREEQRTLHMNLREPEHNCPARIRRLSSLPYLITLRQLHWVVVAYVEFAVVCGGVFGGVCFTRESFLHQKDVLLWDSRLDTLLKVRGAALQGRTEAAASAAKAREAADAEARERARAAREEAGARAALGGDNGSAAAAVEGITAQQGPGDGDARSVAPANGLIPLFPPVAGLEPPQSLLQQDARVKPQPAISQRSSPHSSDEQEQKFEDLLASLLDTAGAARALAQDSHSSDSGLARLHSPQLSLVKQVVDDIGGDDADKASDSDEAVTRRDKSDKSSESDESSGRGRKRVIVDTRTRSVNAGEFGSSGWSLGVIGGELPGSRSGLVPFFFFPWAIFFAAYVAVVGRRIGAE